MRQLHESRSWYTHQLRESTWMCREQSAGKDETTHELSARVNRRSMVKYYRVLRAVDRIWSYVVLQMTDSSIICATEEDTSGGWTKTNERKQGKKSKHYAFRRRWRLKRLFMNHESTQLHRLNYENLQQTALFRALLISWRRMPCIAEA